MSNQENEPILPLQSSSRFRDYLKSLFSLGSSDDSLETMGYCKATTVILVVLFVCGILALGLSALLWIWEDSGDKGHTTPPPPTPCLKRIVGFYTNNESKDSTNTQLEKLTHAVFAYIRMDGNGTLSFKNEKAKQRFLSLRNKAMNVTVDVKLMISIGGPNNAEYFSGVLSDQNRQRKFMSSIISFLRQYQLHGVDIFWRWPSESEKHLFSTFIKDLHETLKEGGANFSLSITVPPADVEHQTTGFDIDDLVQNVDFFNIYSMDFYGPWKSQWGTPTGPIAPLYGGIGLRKNFNVDYSIQYYSSQTRQTNKFNIVIPTFGRLWKYVRDAVEPGKEIYRNAVLKDNQTEGDPYMSRRTMEREGWKLSPASWDEESKSSYIYVPDSGTFLTFETERSLKAKKDYIKEKNLGGVWIWAVDMDDEKNSVLNVLANDEICFVNDV